MQFLKKEMNCNKNLIYFLLFPSFSIKTWKWKEKNTEKMACITFNVALKRDFLQNVGKTNRKV